MNDGVKHDTGKTSWRLLPWRGLEDVARVAMYGAERYGVGNWRNVERGSERYLDAAFRHLIAHAEGSPTDESGLPHLAHAAWNLLAILAGRP